MSSLQGLILGQHLSVSPWTMSQAAGCSQCPLLSSFTSQATLLITSFPKQLYFGELLLSLPRKKKFILIFNCLQELYSEYWYCFPM